MDKHAKQTFIRDKARQNPSDREGKFIFWSRHAITELINESWERGPVERALEQAVVIEDYLSQHRALPDCLVLGWFANGKPIHAVIAIDQSKDRVFVVTVYCPSAQEWENDWTTRK